MLVISREEVRQHLSYAECIALMREAMIALSRGETKQLLRQILDLGSGHLFGLMPGAISVSGDVGQLTPTFGVKAISIFPESVAKGLQSHQGALALFDADTGALLCIMHAGEVTAIRTAAASAVATDALARKDAAHLAVLGTGEQARTHIRAITCVRKLQRITVWGRSAERAASLARSMAKDVDVPIQVVASVEAAVAGADIICTVTGSRDPILESRWVAPGAHVNVVGSSYAGPVEVDNELVARSRYFADHRESVLRQGAEFIRAREAGSIDESHLLGEIGEVLSGATVGRQSPSDVTVYKSLGSIVQDLSSGSFLYRKALQIGFGSRATFD